MGFAWLRLLPVVGLLFASAAASAGDVAPQRALADVLGEAAPLLDRPILDLAVAAMDCAIAGGMAPARRLAVIDYSRPSSEPRLWIFDLAARKLLHEELVAHGQGSGDNLATRFSNRAGSHQSSLGLFRTEETYVGRHGYALRMDGLEPGVNDRARERAIVIHGADYVDAAWVSRHGRIGRSQGCPAVRPAVAEAVVESLKGGQFLFSYYPDKDWLSSSPYLGCQQPGRLAGLPAEEARPGG